jgi:hypothetical protein
MGNEKDFDQKRNGVIPSGSAGVLDPRDPRDFPKREYDEDKIAERDPIEKPGEFQGFRTHYSFRFPDIENGVPVFSGDVKPAEEKDSRKSDECGGGDDDPSDRVSGRPVRWRACQDHIRMCPGYGQDGNQHQAREAPVDPGSLNDHSPGYVFGSQGPYQQFAPFYSERAEQPFVDFPKVEHINGKIGQNGLRSKCSSTKESVIPR